MSRIKNKPKTVDLRTLCKSTSQEVFDFIVNHLRTQGKKALNTSGMIDRCRYRLEAGETVLKCAAGCLIPDDLYNEKFEGKTWVTLCEDGFVSNEHSSLIDALQKVHDQADPKEWETHFERVAREFNLKYKLILTTTIK